MSKPYTSQQWVQQQIAGLAVKLMADRDFAALAAVEIAAEIWEAAGAAAEREPRPKDKG